MENTMATLSTAAALSGVLLRSVPVAAYMDGSGSDGSYGHMSGYGMGFFGIGHWLIGILLIVLFAALIAGFVRLFTSGGGKRSLGEDPMTVLDLLYSKGEISREEYLKRKADITGG
jgi:uncharacterized membrane protein